MISEQTSENIGQSHDAKGEIKITFVDEVEETGPVDENVNVTEEVAATDPVVENATEDEVERAPQVSPAEDPVSQTESDVHPTLVEPAVKEIGKAATPPEFSPTEKKESDTKSWISFESADAMLADLGPDKIKNILAEMGLKCGGTPVVRSERLFSVRNLAKEEIPASLFATSGKGRKRKVAEFVDR